MTSFTHFRWQSPQPHQEASLRGPDNKKIAGCAFDGGGRVHNLLLIYTGREYMNA